MNGGHTHAEIYLHLVWATRGREPMLTADIEAQVHHCIQAEAEKLRCVVLAIGGMPDHIHLAVQILTSLSVSQLVKQVKGVSSKFAADELLPHFGWQEGYSVFSLSRPHLAVVVKYIAGQKQHHADGKLWPDWEATE